jgi:acyl-homoserine lactone acylase PvdQ
VAKKRGKRSRSIAAKKGWETRRKNAELSALREKDARAIRRDPLSRAINKETMRTLLTQAGLKIAKRTSYKRMNEIWLDFLGHQKMELADARAKTARAEQEVKKIEEMMPLIANQAIKETVIRLHEKMGEPPEGWEDDDYHVIRSRMSMASTYGDPSIEAERLANEYNLSPREIFTIWLSP